MLRNLGLGIVRWALAGAALVAVPLLGEACSSDREGFDDVSSDASGAFATDAGVVDGDVAEAAACSSATFQANALPLDMLLLMDRSSSMTESNKWGQATNAMRSFLDAPPTSQTRLGFVFFPAVGTDGTDSQCAPGSYFPVVELEALPDVGSKIKDALVAASPGGNTPMATALTGSLAYFEQYMTAHPQEVGIVLLVTDGEPTGCPIEDVASVESQLSAAVAGKSSIRTFVIGMQGANFFNLDRIAAAGKGRLKALDASGDADAGTTAQQALLDALETVRQSAVGCDFQMPSSGGDGIIDPSSMEVHLTPSPSQPLQTMKRVASKDACGDATGGFYFDDPANPTRVTLCPASCDAVHAASAPKVELFVGCIEVVH